MKESDQLVTSFVTPFGMYCYVTMPFGLRNAGATCQRCMLHVFGKHIGSTVEAYVDDIIVKSKKRGDLIQDLKDRFQLPARQQDQAQPREVRLRRTARHALGLHSFPTRHQGQSRKSERMFGGRSETLGLQEWGRSETSRKCKKLRDHWQR